MWTRFLIPLHCYSLVLQDLDLHAAILGATLSRLVVGHRIVFAVSERLHRPAQIQPVFQHKVLNHCICAALAQRPIPRGLSGRVSESDYLNQPSGRGVQS